MPRKKNGGRNFKKGNPGGPGRPAVPKDIREFQAKNRVRWTNKITFMSENYSTEELRKIYKEGKDEKAGFAILIIKFREGSLAHAECLAKWVCGPEPRTLDVKVEGTLTLENLVVGSIDDK